MINPSESAKNPTMRNVGSNENLQSTARKYTISRAKKKTAPVNKKPQQEVRKAFKNSDDEGDRIDERQIRESQAEKMKKRTREEPNYDEDKENIGTKIPSSSALQKKSKTNTLEKVVNRNMTPVQPDKPRMSLSVSILHNSINKNEDKEKNEMKNEIPAKMPSSTKKEVSDASKLISYACNLKCKQCLKPYTTATNHQPKIICWTQSIEGSVCRDCAHSMMKENASCPYCNSHTVQPPTTATDFVTNGCILEIIRLVTDPAVERQDKMSQFLDSIHDLVKKITSNIDLAKRFLNIDLASKFMDSTLWNRPEDELAMKEFIFETLFNFEKTMQADTLNMQQSLEIKRDKLIELEKSKLKSMKNPIQANKPIENKVIKSDHSDQLLLIALSQSRFLYIIKEENCLKIRVMNENQTIVNETQFEMIATQEIISQQKLSLSTYFSKDFLVLSFLDTKKIVKYHHNNCFSPIIDMDSTDMRLLFSSNTEICFFHSRRGVIRTFDFSGKKFDQIGPFQYTDKSRPFYASPRLQLFSISTETLYVRDPNEDSSLVTIRIIARKTGLCIGKQEIQESDQALVDLLGRIVLIIRSRKRIFMFDSKDLKKTNEIRMHEKDDGFQSCSITQDNELALLYGQCSNGKYFNLN